MLSCLLVLVCLLFEERLEHDPEDVALGEAQQHDAEERRDALINDTTTNN